MEHTLKGHAFKKGLLVGTVIGGLGAFFAFSNKTSKMRKKLAVKFDDIFEEVISRTKDLTDLTKDSYESIVDEVVSKYQTTLDVSSDLVQQLEKDLKRKWDEVQVYFLYMKLRSKLIKTGEVTKEKFNDLAEELVHEYGEKNVMLKERTRSIVRKLKDKWSSFKEEIEESDQE